MPLITLDKDYKNGGAKMTTLKLEAVLNNFDPATIRNIQVMASFDYTIKERLTVTMKSLAHVNIDTPFGAANTQVIGRLVLVQDDAMSINNGVRIVYDEDPISAKAFSENSITKTMQKY